MLNNSIKSSPFRREVAAQLTEGSMVGIRQDKESFLNRNIRIKSNPRLINRAKGFAKQMTLGEKIIWFNILKSKQLCGLKVVKQKQVFSYILDFYCSEILLAIEIDGESHNQKLEYDIERSGFLNSIGIEIVRFTNEEIKNNIEGVQTYLKNHILDKLNI